VLPVGVEDQDEIAGGRPDAALHRRAVSLVVRMADDPRPGGLGGCRGPVAGAVVHDENLVPAGRAAQAGNDLGDDLGLAVRRDDDRGLFR